MGKISEKIYDLIADIRNDINYIEDLIDDHDTSRCEVDGNDDVWDIVWRDEFYSLRAWTPMTGKHRDGELTDQNYYRNEEGNLVMTCEPLAGKISTMSYLKSYNGKNPQNYDDNSLGDNYFVDFTEAVDHDILVEAKINLEKAFGSEDAWFAFWLMGPNTWNHDTNEPWVDNPKIPYMCSYDCNANTGMEIDIMEYAPFSNGKRNNGFNVAAYTGLNDPGKHLKPTHNSYGYFEDINNHIKDKIDLTKGFHTFQMLHLGDRIEFKVDGQTYWRINEKEFVPMGKNMGIRLSWELQRGLWRGLNEEQLKERGIKSFLEIGKTLSAEIEYVQVLKKKRD